MRIYYQLKDRSPQDKVLVFNAVKDATASFVPTEHAQELALADVRACAEALEIQSPGKNRYVNWRSKQPRPGDYLSDTAIRNAFAGSWSNVHAAMGAGALVDPTALRLTAQNKYTREGLLRTLDAWYQALGATSADPHALTKNDCHSWMQERRAAGDRPDLDLPRDRCVWISHFGSWADALATAGLLEHRSRAGDAIPSGAISGITDELLLEDLRTVVNELGGAPGVGPFDAHVAAIRRAEARENVVCRIHQSESYRRRFGSWPDALHRAGLIPDRELHRRRPRSSYTEQEALAWVRAYLDEAGPQISGGRYQAWRDRALDTQFERGAHGAIPSDRYLRGRFGSLKNAAKRAQNSPTPNNKDTKETS